jgi:aryl-alcohol dehydrogenase-like predicted oxidoreductase
MKRKIGQSGVAVSPIGLGGMPMSISGRPDEAQSIDVIKAFVDGGGNFIDTANVYCLDDSDIGHNERLIAKALKKINAHERVIVATKGGLRRPRGAWTVDGSPAWLRHSCEKSLIDLGVEVITLYQLHAVDDKVKFADTLGELERLQREGKILHIGLSNVNREQLQAAIMRTKIVSIQNRCNPFDKKDFKNGLISFCKENSIAYVAYSPVGGHNSHVRVLREQVLVDLAKKYTCSPYCVALAWLLAKGDHIIPIPGASKVASISDSLQATAVNLDGKDISQIDRLPD